MAELQGDAAERCAHGSELLTGGRAELDQFRVDVQDGQFGDLVGVAIIPARLTLGCFGLLGLEIAHDLGDALEIALGRSRGPLGRIHALVGGHAGRLGSGHRSADERSKLPEGVKG